MSNLALVFGGRTVQCSAVKGSAGGSTARDAVHHGCLPYYYRGDFIFSGFRRAVK